MSTGVCADVVTTVMTVKSDVNDATRRAHVSMVACPVGGVDPDWCVSPAERRSARTRVATRQVPKCRPPTVRLELEYLYEVGRTSEPALPVLDALQTSIGLRLWDAPFAAVIREAEAHKWTRDPYDRIIVAQDALNGAPLLTKDEQLRAHYADALW
jgi:PIN domain nuclease of toxin-antitoxin system